MEENKKEEKINTNLVHKSTCANVNINKRRENILRERGKSQNNHEIELNVKETKEKKDKYKLCP